jgi:CMP-N-acetylneuraminic acid synthetase
MIIAIIPAKGESTRLPNKNMYPILGKPMLEYSIDYARKSRLIERIYVSTDSSDIADYAKAQKLEVIMRGRELGGDTPIVKVYEHAVSKIDVPIEVVVGIQPDHPDRLSDVDQAIQQLIDKKLDEIITVDIAGKVNGSLKIISAKSLREGKIGRVITMMDNCINIHDLNDVKQAEKHLSGRGY